MMFNIKKLKNKFKFSSLILVFLLISSIVLISLLYSTYLQKIKDVQVRAESEFSREYSITLSIYSEMAESLYNTVIKQPAVVNIFKMGVDANTDESKNFYREELYNLLLPMYSEIIKYNFRQLHFHDSSNHSFLRFHKPEKFGDDLTDVRTSVRLVNSNYENVSGFEEGRIYNGYRFVFPIVDKTEHIGSVEISSSMLAIINILHSRFNIPSQFILSKDVVDEKIFKSEQGNYVKWGIDDRYVLDREISEKYKNNIVFSNELKKAVKSALDSNETESFSLYTDILSNNSLLLFIPIKNFEDKVVGYLLSYRTYDELDINRKAYFILTGSIVILIIVMSLFVIYYDKSQEKIQKLADFDYLTETYMRRILMDKLDNEIVRAKRYNTKFSIIMFDIDYFKKINDLYGHTYGDYVLKEISSSVLQSLRKSDIIGRYGGEEFVIVLPEIPLEKAVIVAEDVRNIVDNLILKNNVHVTISCGVEEFHKEYKNSLELINKSDEKLYKAKDSGRNIVVS